MHKRYETQVKQRENSGYREFDSDIFALIEQTKDKLEAIAAPDRMVSALPGPSAAATEEEDRFIKNCILILDDIKKSVSNITCKISELQPYLDSLPEKARDLKCDSKSMVQVNTAAPRHIDQDQEPTSDLIEGEVDINIKSPWSTALLLEVVRCLENTRDIKILKTFASTGQGVIITTYLDRPLALLKILKKSPRLGEFRLEPGPLPLRQITIGPL